MMEVKVMVIEEKIQIEIDSSIWREEIQNRNRLLDLAGSLVEVRNGGKRKVVLAWLISNCMMHTIRFP